MAASVDRPDDEGAPVSIGRSLVRSARFKALFAEGMELVEEAASYLDGPGRADADALRLGLKGAYAAESMRLTTRLMQIASWLLIRRAIVDGETTPDMAERNRARFTLTAQDLVSSPAVFGQLPVSLQRLTDRSLRLQSRVLQLDRMVNHPPTREEGAETAGLDRQFAMLRAAFTPEG